MPNLQTAEMNRFSRDLYRRALDLRFKAEDGATVRDDARRLSAEAAAVKSTALANLTPVATRVKYLQSHSFNSTGANAHSYLQSLGPHGFKAALPGIVAKANAGDEEALAFAGAAIGILDNMPGAQRPLTSKKLARIIDLPEFDADHPSASEAVNLITATEKLARILADGRTPTTPEKIALGQLLNDVRPADALADENEALFAPAEEEQAEEDTPDDDATDTAEPDATSDDAGPDSGGETPGDDTDGGTESEDPDAEDSGGAENAEEGVNA